ncbi:MAG: hypothetical protein VX988_03355 [Planctomycetota bacterium]|nr:hypothetical protein [Planctomycetota bacterium]
MPVTRAFIAGLIATAVFVVAATGDAQITPPVMRFPTPIGTTAPTAVSQPVTPAPNLPAVTPPPSATVSPPTTTPLPATPSFDPYADPTAPVQGGGVSSPYVTDPYSPPPSVNPNYQPIYATAPFGQWAPKFLQHIRFKYTYIDGGSANGLQFNSLEFSGTFLIPFLFNQNAPLLVTPGFATHLTEGPSTATGADLPGSLYDAFVDVAWRPQVTRSVSADLGVRVGIYSDFNNVREESIRFMGRGVAVWRTTDTHEWRAGVAYLDRLGIKLLPVGGVIWTPQGPQGSVRWELLFPNPKLAWRLPSWRTYDVWWYVAGEFGGGCWTVTRDPGGAGVVASDEVEYSDYRLLLGIEWKGHYGLKGFAEVGYVWERELDYYFNDFDFDPKDSLMLRVGLTY